MRYVAIALSAEGSTDEAFLWPIIYRTALSLAANAIVGETPFFLRRGTNAERVRTICQHGEEFDVFIIHADATNAAYARICQSIVEAIRGGIAAECKISEERLVGLITISEMESWVLACPDALARSVGFRKWPDDVALDWNPTAVESLADPKATLLAALRAMLRRPISSEMLHETLETVGNFTPLETLSRLPSYQRFRQDLQTCFVALRASI